MTGWATNKGDEAIGTWDSWADKWAKRCELETEFTQRQADAIAFGPEDTVLDACCGTGRLTVPLARRARRVTALDASPNMLAWCRRRCNEAGLTNVETKLVRNWHSAEPGVDFEVHDVAVACISPASADLAKLSRAARKRCYSLSFSKPFIYGDMLYNLFAGITEEWRDAEARMAQIRRPDSDGRSLELDLAFNVLYELGTNPKVDYVDGGWVCEGDSPEEVYSKLAKLDEVLPGMETRFRDNVDRGMRHLPNGGWRYEALTQMYVLSWDPNEVEQRA